MDTTFVCCDCGKRMDLAHSVHEDGDKNVCCRCYLRQVIEFARDNGFIPKGMSEEHKTFYSTETILNEFVSEPDYYSS